MSDEIVQASMAIILNAGDARVACKQALDALAEFDFDLAKLKLKEANSKIVVAHQVQTDTIASETRGEQREYSVLFAHAQDTLMTIYSELNIAKQLLKIGRAYHDRLTKLEEKFNGK